MQQHEYALLGGINRAIVGRYITLFSASVSSAVVFILLNAVDLARRFGIYANLPPIVLSLVGAGSVFAAMYFLFDRYLWKMPIAVRLHKVPDLSGDWACTGQTINSDKTLGWTWSGTASIAQSWDKIRVHVDTDNSFSDSIAAAVTYDEIDGYHLLYHYYNTPKATASDLKAHRGFSELIFAPDCKSAKGEYFNGSGRFTFGTIKLVRN